MPTIIPPITGNYSALLKGVSPNQNPGTATQVPPGIISLPSGTILHGEISQIDGRGNAILSTSQGNVSLQTDLAIKLGSEVVLRLTTSSKGVKARIISVNGLSPQDFANKSSAPRGQQIHVDDIVQTGKQEVAAKPLAGKPAVPIKAPLATSQVALKPTTEAVTLRGVLLSRAESLPQVLQALPSSINVPTQRLESGTIISVRLLPQTIQLPQTPTAGTATGQSATPAPTTTITPPTAPATTTPTTNLNSCICKSKCCPTSCHRHNNSCYTCCDNHNYCHSKPDKHRNKSSTANCASSDNCHANNASCATSDNFRNIYHPYYPTKYYDWCCNSHNIKSCGSSSTDNYTCYATNNSNEHAKYCANYWCYWANKYS